MVCDDHGRKRRILGKLLRLGGESIGSVIEHFMTAEAVEQAKAPMPELERLYREAVPEAVEYLGELYTLREGAYHLSKRWTGLITGNGHIPIFFGTVTVIFRTCRHKLSYRVKQNPADIL